MGSAGIAVRVQGLNKSYALLFVADKRRVVILKAKDELRTELACVSMSGN